GRTARPGRDRGSRRGRRGGGRDLFPLLHRQMSGMARETSGRAQATSGAAREMRGGTRRFPILVVGAGHAGCEAACIAARMGIDVGLVSMSFQSIAHMPCDPAIGGLAKGHLVREIDVLGGVMGRMADAAGIQFRMLNRGRGPAVWSPRAQQDKAAYRALARAHLARVPRLTLIEAQVVSFAVEDGGVRGVVLADGATIETEAVVVTPGTFMNGLMHIGDTTV